MKNLIDSDGENRAVRAFLLLYAGSAGVTTTQMRRHMEQSGYPLWPEWAAYADRHLSKGGAQDWLRHLFALEARAQPAQAGQVLTDDDIDSIAKPFIRSVGDHWCNEPAIREQSVEGLARAIESAVLARVARVPMTPEETDAAMKLLFYPARNRAFIDGVEAAERHHGIVGENGGAT